MTGGHWPTSPAAKRGPAAQITAMGGQAVFDDIAARYDLDYLAKVITGCLGAGTEASSRAAAARIVFHVEHRFRQQGNFGREFPDESP